MSYDQLSSLESGRRGGYSDDPDFQDLQHGLKNKLQSLLSNNRKLNNDVNVLGTKKDTPRLRERVQTVMEKTRELCRDIGDGVKRLQTWEDLTVRRCLLLQEVWRLADSMSRNNKNTNRQRFRAIFKRPSKSSRVCKERRWTSSVHPSQPPEQHRIQSRLKTQTRQTHLSNNSNSRSFLN